MGLAVEHCGPLQVLTGAQDVDPGEFHTCAVKSDGTVWCWGDNSTSYRYGDGTTTNSLTPIQVTNHTNVKQFAASKENGCTVKSDSTLWCWGLNTNGAVGDGTNTTRSAPVGPVLTDVTQVSLYEAHACALKADGTAWCWGNGWIGKLGIGTQADKNVPTQVTGITDGAVIVAGGTHSCLKKTDDTVWCWGDNQYGQIGDTTTTDCWTAVQTSNLP